MAVGRHRMIFGMSLYELFTDDARKAMQLANQEAQRFNHEYIGTEHILLGLLKSPGDVAAHALKNLGVDFDQIRREVEKLVQSGPDLVSMGGLPQTSRAKNAIGYAIDEARRLKHGHVGGEHLLLGLLREDECVAAQVLMNQGLRLEVVRDAVIGKPVGRFVNLMVSARLAADIQDLPGELREAAGKLDAEIRAATLAKEQAVGEMNFEKAARLRDQADDLKRQKKALVLDWIRNRQIETVWLSANDAAVKKLALRINLEGCWQDLPLLADALEAAGCMDRELIDHCRQPGAHSKQCWVVDVILVQ